MNLTLINHHSITTSFLPEEVSGKHWLCNKDEEGHTRKLASVDAHEGRWFINAYGTTTLAVPDALAKEEAEQSAALEEATGHTAPAEKAAEKAAHATPPPSKQQVLTGGTSIHEFYVQEGEQVILLAETDDPRAKHFTKVGFSTDTTITIGRDPSNTLVYQSSYVSSHHASITLTDETFTLTDTGSANGVYINGKAAPKNTSLALSFGDTVFIMGLKVIVGKRFLSFNNPHGQVVLNEADNQVAYTPQVPSGTEDDTYVPKTEELFFRSPRIMREVVPLTLSVEDPPAKKEPDESPTILKIGPSLGMALASCMMGIYMISNILGGSGNYMRMLPMGGMIVVMILGAILWPNLSRRYEKKKQAREESKRRAAYAAYLDTVRRTLIRETELQKEILEENRISLEECLRRVETKDRRLFERTSIQSDFLELRLGRGVAPLASKLTFPEDKLALDEDVLKTLLGNLKDEPRVIEDVPLSLNLTKDYIAGVVATKENYYPFLRGLIAQIATLHAPDEVKIVFMGNKDEISEWDFVRFLPHVFDDDYAFRYLVASQRDAQEVSLRLERELQGRLGNTRVDNPGDYGVYYLVIDASGRDGLAFEALSSLTALRSNLGFSVLTFAEDIRSLPKECSRIIELNKEGSALGQAMSYMPKDASGARIYFAPDVSLNKEEAAHFAHALNTLSLTDEREAKTFPASLGLLEMFEAGSVEHLNVQSRWKESDPTLSLAAPLGKDAQGNLSNLDVHEDVHGPHGLIAGMTGSGKSETIITYILSLAVNFKPDEVSFVLIDYKGGGLAGAFDNSRARLPHLSGTITNLDGSAITRSLVSINSELKRRQALFNEAREVAGTSTMDIYAYQRLRRQGQVSEPCPHLFIIADEFAELKGQQPEFMDELISAARIGRSLGIHLILATQKPSGVVNDQIWSNARFKLCLKVADAADSKEMLKRPDAAELTCAGRYFLMVGYNEYFTEGQSAYAGTPYIPKESYEEPKDDTVVLVSDTARALMQIKPVRQGANTQSLCPESVAVLDHLANVAKEEGLYAPRLWLEALPEHITVDELEEKYADEYAAIKADPFTLNPIIGELDDPENQAQRLLTLPITEGGNAIIYGAEGSGVETLLYTMLFSLITCYDASKLNLYLLDFGSETLGIFRDATQVGDVVFAGDEEKVTRFFDMMQKEIANRKRLLSKSGMSFGDYSKHTDEPLASIVVVIDGMSSFYELYPRLEDRLTTLTREANRYGIYFIVTAESANTVRLRLRNNFKQELVLAFNSESDYINVFGSVRGISIPTLYARGLCKNDGIFIYQTASVAGETESESDTIREAIVSTKALAGISAPAIPTMPDRVTLPMLTASIIDSPHLPVGLYEDSLEPATLDFSDAPIQRALYSKSRDGLAFTRAFLELVGKRQSYFEPVLVDAARTLSLESSTHLRVLCEVSDIEEFLKESVDIGTTHSKPCLLIIAGIANLLTRIDPTTSSQLKEHLKSLKPNQGISLLLFDNAAEANYGHEDWAKVQLGNKNGLWVGEGMSAQSVLLPNTGMGNQVDPTLKGNRGYELRGGNLRAITYVTQD